MYKSEFQKTVMEKQYSFNLRVTFCSKGGWDSVCVPLGLCICVCVFISRVDLNKDVPSQLKMRFHL